LQRCPTGTAPFEFVLARATALTHRQADIMLYQIAQNLPVRRRSNKSNTKRIAVCACSSGSNTTSQEAIIVVGWIIHSIDIGNQRIEQGADFQQLMPVTTRARQARHLNAKDQPDIAKTNLRDQSLKTESPFDRRARSAKIIVNDYDRLARPTKLRARSTNAY
jgi:hypothetical protein